MLRRENSQLFQPEHGEDDEDDDDDEDDENVAEMILYSAERKRKAERLIIRHALQSRVFVFLVGFIVSFAGHFDSSGSLLIDNVPQFLQCPANWDGAFNVRIAVHGYEYENMHAFFPMFPLIARTLSRNFFSNWLTSNEYLAAASAGALWNNFIFIITAVVLFRLGGMILNDDRMAMRAALLFCWNPASIFFSAAYSESTFALCAFTGMLTIARDVCFRSRLIATLFFAAATLTRSNGSILGLFSLWAAHRAYEKNKDDPHRVLRAVVELGIVGGIHLSALLLVLGYGWVRFCFLGGENATRPPWCSKAVPDIYSYVQDRYWNVGFMRYYEMKQLPNFLLAAPAMGISVKAIISIVLRGGPGRLPWPFLVQMFVAIVVGAFFMHVQVFTRFIAAFSPVFYWYAASLTMRKTAVSFFVCFYFAFYCMFGTAMFCAYFPWT